MLQTQDNGWDAVRYTVDHCRKMGQFILTGSAVPDKNAEKGMEIHTNIESPGQRTANINFL